MNINKFPEEQQPSLPPYSGELIEGLLETVARTQANQPFETAKVLAEIAGHNHRCMVCGAHLECDPTDCIAEENLVCGYCDGR